MFHNAKTVASFFHQASLLFRASETQEVKTPSSVAIGDISNHPDTTIFVQLLGEETTFSPLFLKREKEKR